MTLDGRYVVGVLGCDLAADAIERQTYVTHTLKAAKRGLDCPRPALVVVAVEPGHEDEAAKRIGEVLEGTEAG